MGAFWLFPFAMLVIESRFIPRVSGYPMMLAGTDYLLQTSAIILFPRYAQQVGRITLILALGELPIIFWLLIWGAKWQSIRRPRVQEAA